LPLKPEKKPLKNNHEKVIGFLRLEAGAIERSASTLDRESVERAVELIACCDKKVVVTGVGKSGVIAQKIAQTLTSTGTMAVFVHPSDAIHGGLGVIAAGDVVVALSNSGETDEIITILPAILRRGSSLIAVVGNSDSTLARKAHVVLDASVDKEACPLNLAPTTSTTVALAIGDAIALTVMEAKGLTAEAFAANHPGGQLGKRLTLTVGDLMHPSPDIEPDATWLDVVKALSQHALGAVSVVDGDKGLLGIITEGDLRRSIEKSGPSELSKLTAADMMNRTPTTTNSETLAFEALQLMENRPFQISVLPVVDGDGRASGLLRLHDIVRSGL
jgi:arabinose-5-phosphate isomerase